MAEALPAKGVLGQVLALLLPFFLKGAAGDADVARAAALQLLESYDATSGKELLLAAQIVAFSFSSLDALGKAVAEPELSAPARLRQRGNANALHRAGEQCRKALDRSHHPRPPVKTAAAVDVPPPAPEAQARDIMTAMQKVQQAIVQAAPSLAQRLTNEQPISRQQRRYLARKAEERLLQQEREARKAVQIARLAANRAAASPGPQPLAPAAEDVRR